MRTRRGFTLLEIMIAVFLLALASAVLMGTQSTGMRMMGYSNNLSIITLLTRAKMQDVEYEMQAQAAKEGVKPGYRKNESGDYADEGYPDIKWEVLIESVEIEEDASNDFVESVTKQLYGEGDEGGALSGNMAFTQHLPMMISFFPAIINQLGQRVRRITLKTSWEYLGEEQYLTVSQYSVVLKLPEGSQASGESLGEDAI